MHLRRNKIIYCLQGVLIGVVAFTKGVLIGVVISFVALFPLLVYMGISAILEGFIL